MAALITDYGDLIHHVHFSSVAGTLKEEGPRRLQSDTGH